VITPSGPFLHVGKIKKYASEDAKYYMNDELLSHAQKNQFFIPSDHFLMPIVHDYMDNDNVKYHQTHIWNPDKRAWLMATTAIERIYEFIYSDFQPLTFDESIAIAEKTTSAGYLFKKMKCAKKGDVFNNAYELLKTLFFKVCNGEDVETIFEMAPKVEIRSLDKLINIDETKRKQRTFVVSDVLHYIVGISLYYNFNKNIVATCDNPLFWNAVGVSIFKGGWNTLACNLLSKSLTFRCYDEKAMESCVTMEFQEAIYNMRHRFITIEWSHAAQWYKTNVMFSKVLDHRGNMFIKISQNPSGHGNTLSDNGHAMELKGLYHLAKESFDVNDLVSKYRTCGKKVVGDDSIVPDKPLNLGDIWKDYMSSSRELGFETTEESDGAQPLSKVKFLNFGFQYNLIANQYTFVTNYDKLFAGLYFYRKSNSWRLTLARLYAMKVLCYSNMDRYLEVNNHISYILHEHTKDLLSETNFDDIITMNALLSQDKSREEIRRLIFNLD
jgi:hypothetical protein